MRVTPRAHPPLARHRALRLVPEPGEVTMTTWSTRLTLGVDPPARASSVVTKLPTIGSRGFSGRVRKPVVAHETAAFDTGSTASGSDLWLPCDRAEVNRPGSLGQACTHGDQPVRKLPPPARSTLGGRRCFSWRNPVTSSAEQSSRRGRSASVRMGDPHARVRDMRLLDHSVLVRVLRTCAEWVSAGCSMAPPGVPTCAPRGRLIPVCAEVPHRPHSTFSMLAAAWPVL